ncbi:MAG: hypothetical protein ACRDNP_06510 [Gaiellaceae bacterium]
MVDPRLAAATACERATVLESAAGLAAVTVHVSGLWSEPERVGGAAADHRSFPVLHGLYCLCGNLAGLGPLLISVDNARWSDAPSLRSVAHLSRRLEEHPILLLVTVCPAEIEADTRALSQVLADPLARVRSLAPLSAAAVSALVRRSSSSDVAEHFCRARHAAMAGNPLFPLGLTASLPAEGIAPTAAAAERLEERVSRAASSALPLKLAGLPPAAIELARAVATLGGAELRHAAALVRIDGGAASQAEAALKRAGIFEARGALRLRHLIVPAAIYDDLPPAKRSRGARTLLEDPGFDLFAASTAIHCARLELLVGDLSTAEEELRRAYDALASIGEKYLLPHIAALLAQVVHAQGRVDEAEQIGRAAEELAAADDAELEALWPSVRSKVLAWQKRADEAERRAREAVDLIRIRATLCRLTAWHSQNARGDNDRSASDRRAWNARRHAVAPGLARERFLRDILANKKLPDGYARGVALEALDIPEELFAKMMAFPSDASLDRSPRA